MPVFNAEKIAEYVELIDVYGVGSDEARRFKDSHSDDPEFLRVARGAEQLFEYRRQVFDELESATQLQHSNSGL